MADSSKISILLCLFTLLFSHQIYGRESQFFNKISSINNNNVAPLSAQNQPNHVDPLTKPSADQEPTFIPENENGGYGLYGHQSTQLSPTTTPTTTTTTTNNDPSGFSPKYLPKNYNTVAYVTQPEGYTQPKATNNNYEDSAYVRDQSQSQSYSASSANGDDFDRSYNYPTNNYNANGYNSQPQQQSVDQFKLDQKSNYNTNTENTENSNYYNSNSNPNVEKQGMSDTRFMENGRYFYDINSEGNSNRYPFALEDTRTYNNNNNNGGYDSRTFGDQYNNNNNGGNSHGSINENSYDVHWYRNQDRFEGHDDEQFQDFQNQRALP